MVSRRNTIEKIAFGEEEMIKIRVPTLMLKSTFTRPIDRGVNLIQGSPTGCDKITIRSRKTSF